VTDFDRYHLALGYAAELHRGQIRKGSGIPYLTHLMSVSALVLEYGGSDTQAIAALLHDAIEDRADGHGGPSALAEEIERLFGHEVIRLVQACTDAGRVQEPDWRTRRWTSLRRLQGCDAGTALILAADKLHNTRCLLADHRTHGDALFARFEAGKADVLWYLEAAAVLLERHHPGPISNELQRTVSALQRQCSAAPVPRVLRRA
jgi:(p)ppGpp synthase/HD superfamily hydrolase